MARVKVSGKSSDLRDYFDRVVLINLKRRPDRLARTRQALHRCKWPFKEPIIVPAVDGHAVPSPDDWKSGPGAWGCLRSHQNVLEAAIADGVDKLLVLEDDVCFVDTFSEDIADFLKNVPDDWDQLMIGGQHKVPLGLPEQINDYVYRCVRCERTHCYAIRGPFMRKFYQRLAGGGRQRGEVHCDWIMSRDPEMQMQHRVYSPIFFLAGQDESTSDIFCRETSKQYWNPPGPKQPLFFLNASAEVASELREYGLFFGPDVDPAVGPYKEFEKIVVDNSLSPRARIAKLGGTINELQWLVESSGRLAATVWHPGLSEYLVQRASIWKVKVVNAQSVSEALKLLPKKYRRRRSTPLALEFVLYLKAEPEVMDAMRIHGWHNGYDADEKYGYSKALMDLYRTTIKARNRDEVLLGYISQLQKEAAALINGIAVIYHPGISVEEVRAATSATVIELAPK